MIPTRQKSGVIVSFARMTTLYLLFRLGRPRAWYTEVECCSEPHPMQSWYVHGYVHDRISDGVWGWGVRERVGASQTP